MSKTLVITEKPSVANDIAAALGGFHNVGGYLERDDMMISWSIGHILTLLEPDDIDPLYKRWLIKDLPIIPPAFEIKPSENQKDRLKVLVELIKRTEVGTVVNACDAGREGELIFREIYRWSKTEKPMKRLWLSSMTPAAIRDGFKTLEDGSKYDGLGDAASSRSESDWLIGMNATRGLTRRMSGAKSKGDVWSAGRVQTPTLALMVDQEMRILAHDPMSYWQIKATFAARDHEYLGQWITDEKRDDHVKDTWILAQERVAAILEKLNNGSKAALASETRKPSREAAPPLFDLTSLQREANRRFGMTAKRTLQAAQRLYEAHKALTYPRTDSRCLPEDYRPHVDKVIDGLTGVTEYKNGAKYLKQNGRQNEPRIFNNAGVSDHFAIIPTGEIPSGLQGDDRRIFDLVVRRFLAAFHPPAIWERVERLSVIEGETFRTRARTLQVPGWLGVFDREPEEDEAKLPPLSAGQEEASGVGVHLVNADSEESQTKPPPRITEGRLLSLMEHAGKDIEDELLSQALADKGLGTPATRADIVENLIVKGYVIRSDKALRATAKGIRLIDTLRRIDAGQLASAELTGEMEMHLREVEHGKRTRDTFMSEMTEYTRSFVEKLKTFEYTQLYDKLPALGPCPMHEGAPAGEGGEVHEALWGYRCNKEGCNFIIWKEISGRYMDRKAATKLLLNKQVEAMPGFLTRDGREYSATLALNAEGKVDIVGRARTGADGQPAAPETVDATAMRPCPFGKPCSGVHETSERYVCHKLVGDARDAESCGFNFPRTVCQREINREEAEIYIDNRRLPEINDFISRKGKPFTAVLFLKDTGRHGFEFTSTWERKGGRRGAKKDDGAEGEGGTTAKPRAKAKTKAKAKPKAKAKAKKAPAKKAAAKPAPVEAAPAPFEPKVVRRTKTN